MRHTMAKTNAVNASRTIEQLEASQWPDPLSDAPPHVHRCHALRRVPIDKLTSGDLRALITQEIGLMYLMPTALSKLKVDPMLESEHYPGDLLCAAMDVTADYWLKAISELAELKQYAEQAQSLIAASSDPAHCRQVEKAIAQFLKQSS